ncbi:MAG TPA: M23 family metallopeptidase [Candidatus Bathyarchaeia archaeon]|jgi:hypothetical protein|nr:M23 family metallopeptidase [Candidatus Bathyarchaeia archaeon]
MGFRLPRLKVITADNKVRRGVFYYSIAAFSLIPLIFLLFFLLGEWPEHGATAFDFYVATFTFLVTGEAFVFLILTWRWDISGYYVRLAFSLAFLTICFRRGGRLALFVAIASFVVQWLVLSRPRTKSFDELTFPLRNGWYYVAHGGSLRIINLHRHAPVKFQRYALDIVRLNRFGYRARGIYPRELKAYAIFHDILYSPCEGVVTAVVNDLPDLPPGEMDPKQMAGNHIVIQCDGADTFVCLAHLAQGSVCVRPGDTVTVGQRLAQVGNSGNTSEPHLHIQVKRGGRPDSMLDGEGVAIRFDGRWLIRNSVVRSH